MVDNPQDQAIYDALLALKPNGLTNNAWAVKAGVNRNVFNDLHKRGHLRHDTLEKLLAAIGVSLARFESITAPVRTEVAAAGMTSLTEIRQAFEGDRQLRALPLMGTAIAGEHQDLDEDIELVELHLNEVLQYLVRPASLARDPDAYALTILTDSMAPKFEPNDTVAVSPRSPVAIGDYVVVQLRGSEGDDERIKTVLVKRLVRRGAGFIELEQFNPPKKFRVDIRRVGEDRLHKVMGTLF